LLSPSDNRRTVANDPEVSPHIPGFWNSVIAIEIQSASSRAIGGRSPVNTFTRGLPA
jgi:hypothetical protein